MFTLKNFCFCCDLRRGCIVYAWLQMMFVTVMVVKFSWMQDFMHHAFEVHHYEVLIFALNVGALKALQIIKGVSGAALIWGIVKKNHMFFQPWLFINGLENALFSIVTTICFVVACMDPFFFRFLPFLALFALLGWYVWACVFVVYKKDMRPNIIGFDSSYENFNMNNINATV